MKSCGGLKPFQKRIFTRFINPPGSIFRTKLNRDVCAPGSDDCELILPPRAEDWVFDKPGYGLTPVQVAQLRDAGITQVLLCGIETDACILGVAFSLFDAQVDFQVEPDLCWSSVGLHEVALKIIRAQFATGGPD